MGLSWSGHMTLNLHHPTAVYAFFPTNSVIIPKLKNNYTYISYFKLLCEIHETDLIEYEDSANPSEIQRRINYGLFLK